MYAQRGISVGGRTCLISHSNYYYPEKKVADTSSYELCFNNFINYCNLLFYRNYKVKLINAIVSTIRVNYSGVLLNITDENKMKKSSSKYGEYKLFDSYKIKDNIILNIGWADNNFFNIGHISLKSGKLPMAADEVAIESFYLDSFDPTWKLNQIRIIKIGTKEISLKLVGIVENYSSRWVIQNNYYPNMFLFNSDDISNNIKSNYLIGFKQNYSIRKNIEFVQNLLSENEESVINNRLLYTGLNDYEKITVLSVSLQIIILIVSSLSILTILSFFNVNQRIKFAIFKALGCSNKYLYLISILQTTYVYLFGNINFNSTRHTTTFIYY